MEDVEIAEIKKKSIKGIVALTSRTFLLQIIAFGATFLLTIFLSPQVFGIFYVVSAIISFLGYFSDIGLAAALIQKKEELTHDDLTTTFTIQQVLVGAVVIIAFIFSEQIAHFYSLEIAGLWLLRALIFSFFLSSLKTIPSVLLERRLEFNKLIIPQIMETLGFYVVAVLLAWKGFGIQAFTFGVIVQAIVGLVAMYIISPWRISFGYSGKVAHTLLRFGLPFQFNSFIALLKDNLLIVFLGKILPFAQIGYIGWAKKWAEVPLRLIMDSVIRVTFPAFSRLQESKEQLTKAIEKTLFGMAFTIFPVSVALLFFMRPLVAIVPKYTKWEPALLSFYLLAFTSILASLSTPLTNALNAVGKIKITLALMVFWTALTWLFTIVFVHFFGFNGVALALLVVASSLGLVVALAKKIAPFHFIASIKKPLVGIVFQSLWYWVALTFLPHTTVLLVVMAGVGVILYGGILWYIDRDRINGLIGNIFK
ncbi:hypothetical protein A2Z00_04525 [Candidatus Gottesmanbacteria bacterium RBG_13_45_10]|uniref:Uncharacterized protein n=1 Tax=Candidatus Gottesmanbacteria bacterium RBG_13_45_10 TaxID=1798370 RepID=A0A1F5ZHM1_9BACT|nr:MAG: hypothetical protein A2Z00_04525 [Candidatus Gottesmanbacteria bacterium RBG_13_45_10]